MCGDGGRRGCCLYFLTDLVNREKRDKNNPPSFFQMDDPSEEDFLEDASEEDFSDQDRLLKAARDGSVDKVLALLSDNPDLRVNCGDYWAEDDLLETPLILASSRGHVEIVKLLLAPPDIDVNYAHNGESPLSFACQSGQVSSVRVLLKDPRVDVTLDDS